MTARLVIFSDLDGTLLDHETYSWEPARPMLDRLRRAGVPLILATSKTAAEVAGLRADLGFDHCPAIVENGAGVLSAGKARPDGEATQGRIIEVLDRLPAALRSRFTGFSDWDVAELAEKTGLDTEAAARAQCRDFSEPGLFAGSKDERQRFVAALAAEGITAQQGGRFLSLSFGGSKAGRMREIAARFGGTCVALGDAPNDEPMLRAADIGVVIPNPAHPGLALDDAPHIRRAPAPGPQGWAAVLSELLSGTGVPAT